MVNHVGESYVKPALNSGVIFQIEPIWKENPFPVVDKVLSNKTSSTTVFALEFVS